MTDVRPPLSSLTAGRGRRRVAPGRNFTRQSRAEALAALQIFLADQEDALEEDHSEEGRLLHSALYNSIVTAEALRRWLGPAVKSMALVIHDKGGYPAFAAAVTDEYFIHYDGLEQGRWATLEGTPGYSLLEVSEEEFVERTADRWDPSEEEKVDILLRELERRFGPAQEIFAASEAAATLAP